MLVGDIPVYAAHRFPDRVACRDVDRVLTYRQLRDRCWQLANRLQEQGEAGDRVAILSENSLEYALCYFGVPAAGMGLTFLNYRLAPQELAWIINNAEPRVLVVQDKYRGAIATIRNEIPSVERVVIWGDVEAGELSFDAWLDGAPATVPAARPDEDDLAYLLYTSGTTGLPKGAMLSHRNVMAAAINALASWDNEPNSHYLLTFPMYHVGGSFAIAVAYLRAAEVTILREFDQERFFRLIDELKITSTGLVPTMVALLLDNPLRRQYDLSSLRNIGYGASAMPEAVLRRAREEWPQVRFLTGFGMTELAGNVMYLSADDHVRAIDEGLPILTSVGQQMVLSMVRVVDEQMNDVGPGVEGEIVMAGDQVLTGYWRNPEATEKAFTGGWFHSGDVGRWDENYYLTIVDRKKDMIVTGGENVYPREVEEVLYKHAAVLEAAVIGVPDDVWGENVVAIIAPRAGEQVTAAELIEFTRTRIASYKKPKAVGFVDELPKNASGKVLKRTLREMLAEGKITLIS